MARASGIHPYSGKTDHAQSHQGRVVQQLRAEEVARTVRREDSKHSPMRG